MKDWLILLYQTTGSRRTEFVYGNELSFFFDDDKITIRFAVENSIDALRVEDDNFYELFDTVENYPIEYIKIAINEFLNYRPDFGYYEEGAKSVANTTINFIRQLNNVLPGILKNYEYEVTDMSDGYCGTNYVYSGDIYLDFAQVNTNVIAKLITLFEALQVQPMSGIYMSMAADHSNVRKSFAPQFLNTNTKVRRLGYLKIFADFMLKRKRVPETFLAKRFEDFALPFTQELNLMKNNKGVILSLNGNSAEPYLMLLKELDLITTINRVVVPTKWLKTYMVIREETVKSEVAVFKLGLADKMFFLELILKKDFLYTSIILEFLSIRREVSVRDLIKAYQLLLLNRIRQIIKVGTYDYGADTSDYRIVEKRVIAWKEAIVYLEHIVLPRLNWLADLELISLDENKNVRILDAGDRLNTELNCWIDVRSQYVANSDIFIERYYTATFAMTYTDSYGVYPPKDVVLQDVTEYLKKSFSLFQTLAPNRVTASQAIAYAKYMILAEKKYAVSESAFVRFIENDLKDQFIYKYQSRYADGYIQKILLKN
ncbi:MAG: hypothetical protein EOO91_01405 [Pedobacter sp.]|nr:MAG: hypothetical protein EOO91_01405 [Pedobacter sp.]